MAQVGQQLVEADWAAAWEEGWVLDLDRAVVYALALVKTQPV